MEKSDKELLDLYKTNKNAALELIISQFQERLYWHIRKIVIIHDDTHDVLQNTFIKAWKGLDNFQEKSKLYTWLYRIATNESITFINKKKKKQEEPIENYQAVLSNYLDNDSLFSGDQIKLKLQKAILKLPEQQRIVFNMKYFDDLKYIEIAEILNLSVGGLKASYHHAVKKIEKYVLED